MIKPIKQIVNHIHVDFDEKNLQAGKNGLQAYKVMSKQIERYYFF
jgi:phage I-like protein